MYFPAFSFHEVIKLMFVAGFRLSLFIFMKMTPK